MTKSTRFIALAHPFVVMVVVEKFWKKVHPLMVHLKLLHRIGT